MTNISLIEITSVLIATYMAKQLIHCRPIKIHSKSVIKINIEENEKKGGKIKEKIDDQFFGLLDAPFGHSHVEITKAIVWRSITDS